MQIVFNDETTVTLGANTIFRVDEYLEDEKNSKVELSVTQGAFKVITGKIGKLAPERFKFRTKSATIGIRGTIFAGQTGHDRFSNDLISCLGGKIIIKTGQKEVQLIKGEMAKVGLDGKIEKAKLQMQKFDILSDLQKNQVNTSSEQTETLVGDTSVRKFKKDDSTMPTSKGDMRALINSRTTHRYKGKGVGTIAIKTFASLLTQNVKTDVDMKLNFNTSDPVGALSVDFNNFLINGSSPSNDLGRVNRLEAATGDGSFLHIDPNSASLQAGRNKDIPGQNSPWYIWSLSGKFLGENAKRFNGKLEAKGNTRVKKMELDLNLIKAN